MKTPTRPWIDGVERNRLHPATFEIPSAEVRNNLPVGIWIKIGIDGDDSGPGEKFWARVAEVLPAAHGQVRYRARVDNDLVYTEFHGLDYNDVVEVQARHVLSTHTA